MTFVIDLGDLCITLEEDLLARDTGFTFPQPTVATCAIFRTSRNLSISTTGATGSSNQNLVSYDNRDTQLPEQLSPISAPRRSLLDTYTVSVVAHGIYITNTTTLSSTSRARSSTSK